MEWRQAVLARRDAAELHTVASPNGASIEVESELQHV
jgi:hypothetical protein